MKNESPNEASSSEPDPYTVPEVPDIPPNTSRRAGPIAIFFGFLIACVLAAVAFGLSFFFTCLGVVSIAGDGPFALILVWTISGLTTVAAFAFSLWGFLKIVVAIKGEFD
jgi:hypothetical protein